MKPLKINYNKINSDLSYNKQQIKTEISPHVRKLDTSGFNTVIKPIIPVNIAKNLILQNNRLDKSIRILSQDVILNNFSFLSANEKDNPKQVLKFWQDNIDEFFKQAQEYYAYGFGGSEILFDKKTGYPVEAYQIPSETLFIIQEPKPDNPQEFSYYAVQQVNGENIKMKLSRYNYGPEDDDLPTCFWWGNGRTSEFYEIPYWLPAFNSISAKVALDELNAKKINEGNLLSGILTIVAPPLTKNEESPEDTLESQMDDAGTGILTLNLTQYDSDLPLDVKYIPITDSNYDYLSSLAKDCDQDILACFSIPKVRLMIDDVTESMNSNKSDTIYEIYTKSLAAEQLPFEKEINAFNRKYFKYYGMVDIETPIFADKKETEVNSILSLFDKGVLTLGQTIKAIMPYYPDLKISINDNNPVFNERYYNGKLLGFSNASVNSISGLGELDEILQRYQS